ncbi:hypothetical protein [Aquihabitans sp. McL0605]|uniref:hypothetical protein n=1 Tax=Aquihabitans sp. McL0605 TaxID=3415671 RepID=UPI003CF7E426
MRHYEEPVVAHCRTCNRPYCSRCLVYSFGPKKPPFCVACALSASGVRNTTKTTVAAAAPAPTADRRVERAQRRAEKSQAKATSRATKRAVKLGQVGVFPEEPRPTNVPVPKGLPTPASRYGAPVEHYVPTPEHYQAPAEHYVN